MNREAQRDLEVLEAVAQNERITQRNLASRLGIALGLANLYLKRLSRKGHIKCVSVRSNRLLYFITPKGIAEKTRLTYEFMEYSLQLYRDVRCHLRTVLQPMASDGRHRVAIYGTGEAAELAYLSLKEVGLEPVAVFDGSAGSQFLGMAVKAVADQRQFAFDILIVATLDQAGPMMARLTALGIPAEKLLPLRPSAPGQSKTAAATQPDEMRHLAHDS